MNQDSDDLGYYADCYVLIGERNRLRVVGFLDHFIPNRREMAGEYEVPVYSKNPTVTFKSANDLLDYLVTHPKEEHAIYWLNNDDGNVRCAMCFPTSDGVMIFGLACPAKHSGTSIEDALFEDLRKFTGSDIGYVAYEEDPPRNSIDFMVRCGKYKGQ